MRKNLKRLIPYISGNKKILVLLVLVAFFANVFALAAPSISGYAIDYIHGEENVNFSMIAKILTVLLLVYFANSLFTWFQTFLSNLLSYRTVELLRKDVFYKLTKLPLSFFDSTPHGETMSRLTNDSEAVSDGILQGITQLFSGIVIVAGTLIIMFSRCWEITLAILLITVLCVYVSKLIAANSAKMFREQSEIVGELNGYIEENVSNQKIIKAFLYEDESYKKFKEINMRLYKYGQKAQFYSSLVNPTTRYINNLAYISVGLIGGIIALGYGMSVGTVSAFLIYATQFARPINDMAGILTQLQAANASADRIFAIMDKKEESDDSGLLKLKTSGGDVEFSNVDFSYNKNIELIKNLNFQARAGENIAIVGPTGSGKTTIVNLLMRFYDIDSGKIKVDAQDISKVTRDSLRTAFAMVLQESWLFSGTVKENIAYGKKGASEEEIIEAAKKAHAHNFIMRLENGYDTLITEDGGNLSQGQKQLLTIARAMLADPDILILDEATSSVDTMTERRIQKAFLTMMRDRTAFVIAHRLSTIRESDLILVMNQGRIVEQGTHDELIAKNGFYKKLYYA